MRYTALFARSFNIHCFGFECATRRYLRVAVTFIALASNALHGDLRVVLSFLVEH